MPSPALSAPSPTAAPVATALVRISVAEFAAWKAIFDEHGPSRRRAGILTTQVHRVADDPQGVLVGLAAGSFESLGGFLASADRAAAMKRAGVIDSPWVWMLVPDEQRLVQGRPLAGALVRHRVADLAAWKANFDGRASVRAQAGIVGHSVSHLKDDPHEVVVHLQAETLEQLRRFTGSADLKAAMHRGGVEGSPTVTLVESEPSSS